MTTKKLNNALLRADSIFQNANANHSLDKIFAAVSGGNDSQTALRVAHNSDHADLDGIVYIDTGIAVPETKEFVRDQAEILDLEFHVVDSKYRLSQEEYESLVLVFGFPGPPIHNDMFWALKGKPLQRFLKEFDENIGLISGVMEAESQIRMENIGDEPIQEKDHATWISPLYDWLPATVDEYRTEFNLKSNPVTEKLHVSGDCLCAAFGARKELRDLILFYPETAKKIAQLERKTIKRALQGQIPVEYALYGHGRTDERTMNIKRDPDQETLNMCSNCDNRCSGQYDPNNGSETRWESYLKHDELCLDRAAAYCVDCDMVVKSGLEHRQQVHPNAGASPKDLDIRAIPRRCGWNALTQGTISTKNPYGQVCHEYGENHDFERYNGRNEIADLHCTKCGAFEITIPHRDGYERDPQETVAYGVPISHPKFEQATPIKTESADQTPSTTDNQSQFEQFS